MKEKLKKKFKKIFKNKKRIDEELRHSYSRHTHTSSNVRVLESLLRQKQMEMEQQHPRRLADILDSEEYPSSSDISWGAVISIGIIGIMLVLVIWLVISYTQINNKYEKLAKSISEQNPSVNSSVIDQDISINDLENKLAQIEEKVSTYIEQSQLNDVTAPEESEKSEESKSIEKTENLNTTQNTGKTENTKTSQNNGKVENIKQSQNVEKSDNIKESQNPEKSANAEESKNLEKVEDTKESGDGASEVSSNTTDKSSEEEKYMEYTIQKGDTLWKLSTKFFGSGKRAKEIMQINGLKDPENLDVGKKILIPTK